MWSWARDEAVVEKFKKLSLREIFFLISYVFLVGALPLFVNSISNPYGFWAKVLETLNSGIPFLNWMVIGILFISRLDIFSLKIHLERKPLSDVFLVDHKVWAMLLLCFSICAGFLFLNHDIFSKIFNSAKGGAKDLDIIGGIFQILTQEVLFRLILYYSLNRVAGRNFAFFATVFLFACWHDTNVHIYYPLAVVPAAIAFSIVTILTGSIAPSIMLHTILNLIVYIAVIYLPIFFN